MKLHVQPFQAFTVAIALMTTGAVAVHYLRAGTNVSAMASNEPAESPKILIYSDGACSGNPGPGGWGAVLISGEHRKEISGGEGLTTNNRMELLAAISALEALKKRSNVALYTDSAYVKNGITGWVHGWKRNGWRTADKKPVKNVELWQALDALRNKHDVEWHWLKGHAGHPENERADELARQAMAPFKLAPRPAASAKI